MITPNSDIAQNCKKLPLPVGISSYIHICSKCYCVDKTLLIKEILDQESLVTLFTRPRRFGKTLNMDMLKVFFEKTNEDTSIYFKDKKIWGCGKEYQEHQGKYPVIFITFKDVKFSSFESVYKNILVLFQNEFKRYKELLDSNVLSADDKETYIKYKSTKLLPDESFNALSVLAELLYKHYKVKPIVIIDEYDMPIQQGYNNGFYNEIVEFTRNMYSAIFKDNDTIYKGFLAGVLRVSKESIFSGFNNPKTVTVLDEKYSEYFGFTHDEVKMLADYYDATDKYSEICDWYDGYKFGETEIFNPWSVINYFDNECKIKPYWVNTASNDIIKELILFSDDIINEKLQDLLLGKSIETIIDTNILYPTLKTNKDAIFSFLLLTGYLKANLIGVAFDGEYEYELTIPNKEVLYTYKKEILSIISATISPKIITTIGKMIIAGETENLQSSLEKLLLESASFYDSKESFYHGLMFALCLAVNENYDITSNRESGLGRYDIMMMPKNKSLPGIIIEIKTSKKCSLARLKTLAKTALKQIEEEKYDTKMNQNNIRTIYKFGLAFSGKNVVVEKK